MIKPAHLLRAALMGTALTALLTVGASAATLGAGTVTADALRLRNTPATEGEILATAQSGASVLVLEDAQDGWYKVNYNAIEGYMSADYLTVLEIATMDLGNGKVTTEDAPLNLRAEPNTDASVLTTVPSGTVLNLKGIANGWYLVTYSGQTGYVSSDYVAATTEDTTAAAKEDASLTQQIIDYAKQFMGTPYVYGANGPNSFDCSGFTSYVYRAFGYSLNRSASGQLANGVSVSKDQLQPGDLVFFKYRTNKAASHVGMYIGGGQFIHASTNKYVVQIDQLVSGHYANVYVGARRIVG